VHFEEVLLFDSILYFFKTTRGFPKSIELKKKMKLQDSNPEIALKGGKEGVERERRKRPLADDCHPMFRIEIRQYH